MRLRYLFIAVTLLGFVSRIRALQLLGMAAGAFNLPYVVLTLPPANNAIVVGIVCRECDDFSECIIEQVDVGRVMDVGFNDKGITASG